MAAWIALITSINSNGQNMNINVTYYLATDTTLTTPLGSNTVIVPTNLSAANKSKQVVAAGADFRTGYDLTAQYQGTTVNIP